MGAAGRFGMLRLLGATWGTGRLTALSYHRVTPYPDPSFDVFPGTVSATPEVFAAQMDLLMKRHNVVSMDQVIDWLGGKADLPPRPAVITFDDGYTDNSTHALPILRERGLPATVFLTTGLIGTGEGAWWDRVAYAFSHTSTTSAELPLLGSVAWHSASERDDVRDLLITELKTLDEADKLVAMDRVFEQLDAWPEPGAFDGLYLTWDQVREMDDAGFTAAAHTVTHPILTRLDPERARDEIVTSIARVSDEIGRPVRAFAYPNGMPGDHDDTVAQILAEAGVVAAFTLDPGPAKASEAVAKPLGIPRVYIDMRHGVAGFTACLEGVGRLAGELERIRSPRSPSTVG